MKLLLLTLAVFQGARSAYWEWDSEINLEGHEWDLVLVGQPEIMVSKDVRPHPDTVTMESNNNVAGVMFEGRLFMAWRTAPLHFAGPDTRIYIVSSEDSGSTWNFETEIFMGRDLREPFFLPVEDKLHFFFFEGGTNPVDFEPLGLFQMERFGEGDWGEPQMIGHKGEVIWEMVQENGTSYSQSYSGDYSTPGDAQDLGMLNLFFNSSQDGVDWSGDIVYHGGLTEVGYYFDLEGNMWGVGRNEDGDDSGWGSRTFFAPSFNLTDWQWSQELSDQWIYESPKMFRHGSELYLVARTDPGGPFWSADDDLLNILPAWEHHLADLVAYSFRQHGTAIWKLDQVTGELTLVLDLAGCGDTAFPSIIRLSLHEYLILNYSSPMDSCPPSWLAGQTSPNGTLIYGQKVQFVQKS